MDFRSRFWLVVTGWRVTAVYDDAFLVCLRVFSLCRVAVSFCCAVSFYGDHDMVLDSESSRL